MPALRAGLRAGYRSAGGIRGYPLDLLHGEVAILAAHFHWSRAEILALEHAERRRWVSEVDRLRAAAGTGATP
ncbi:MAG TPA: DUF6760 family protein [Mycobacteriales bacterium]|nr:DUF6760 family protein [Mycobacteriales bacterium]